MTRALIGHTGFVGGNLLRQGAFTDLFNSSNVGEVSGRSFERVVCAGAPAVKWRANQEPEQDRANLGRLMDALGGVRAERFVLISTVDVFPVPVEVDERTPIDPAAAQPYGRHRLELEAFVRERFPDALIVRLPGLFGPGLKKNVIYDFLHAHRLEHVHQDAVFQFYDLAHLSEDLALAERTGLRLVHLTAEPTSVREVASAFGLELENRLPPPAPRYDFRSAHADVWGRSAPYQYDRAEVLAGIRAWIEAERAS